MGYKGKYEKINSKDNKKGQNTNKSQNDQKVKVRTISKSNETGAAVVNGYESATSIRKAFKDLGSAFAYNIKKGYESVTTKLKKSKFARNIVIFGLVGTLGLGIGLHLNKKNQNTPNNTTTITTEDGKDNSSLIAEDSLFNAILNLSKSEKQKTMMSNLGRFLGDFNIRFAEPIAERVVITNAYGEETEITVKPALSWEEAVSMSLVYNNYSKSDLREILNGADIDSNKLINAYKNGMLQLMGAHILETKDNQVNIDILLQSKQAKEFYNKYHKMFLECKATTGEERLAAVQKFYDEVYKDFPISSKVREEGISHSEPRNSIESYKFSVVPMIAAAEMMYQNLEIDHTLSQEAIDYLNDIGACNIAEDILEKAEYISASTPANDDYASYGKLRASLIAYLEERDAYVIDDEHRDLSSLESFQEIINGFLLEPYTYTVTTTYTVTSTYTTTEKTVTSDRDTAVDMAGEDAVAAAEREAQQEMDKQNEQNRQDAERRADEKAEEMQREEDKKKQENQEIADRNNQNLQDNIGAANENINNGGTVNEGDLGHGARFDNDHSNSNGDLNDSVKDITTNGSGAVDSNTPLPDPNAMAYRSEALPKAIATTANDDEFDAMLQSIMDDESIDYVYEYEEPGTFTSMEEIDAYIESLSNYAEDEVIVQYTK